MRIVDSQIHIWGAHTPERPWPRFGFEHNHGADDYLTPHVLALMDSAGVDAAILVPPAWEGDRNDLCLAAAQKHPHRFAVMGRMDVSDRSNTKLLATWRQTPGMLGLRVTFSRGRTVHWLEEGTADWLWPEAEQWNIPLMIWAPGQTPHLRRIATDYPRLRLVVDHLGIPSDLRDHEILHPLRETLGLADLPNVAVKVSALPSVVTEAFPFPFLQSVVRDTVSAFGPSRVFWGSDLSRLACTYREAVQLFTHELGFLTDSDLEWIMGKGIESWLGWDRG